jgi:hypothetical protein
MKKLSAIVYYFVTSVSLLTATLAFAYTSLPVEYQALIPEWTWLNSITLGGSTGIIGIGGLYLKQRESTIKLNNDKIFNVLMGEIKNLRDEVCRNTKLNETSLKVKRSDKLISEETRKIIDEVL